MGLFWGFESPEIMITASPSDRRPENQRPSKNEDGALALVRQDWRHNRGTIELTVLQPRRLLLPLSEICASHRRGTQTYYLLHPRCRPKVFPPPSSISSQYG
jgi:hypothetical protein